MSGLDDDLEKAKAGLFQVLEGATQLEQAATAVAKKVDAVASHLADPATLGRLATASLGAAIEAAGREMKAASTRLAPPESPPSNAIRCRRHGEHPWQRTIVCTSCGRVFQVLHASTAHFAPDVCLCGVRLLPGLRIARSSAVPICTLCFTGIAASGGRAVRRTE